MNKNIESDEKDYPWFCETHQLQSVKREYTDRPDKYYCPECDRLICEEWEYTVEQDE